MKSLLCFHISQGHYCWPTEKQWGIRGVMLCECACPVGAAWQGRGRAEAAGGGQTSLQGQVPKERWGLQRAEGEGDRWLVCLLLWAWGDVSLFTFVSLSALSWTESMSSSDPPGSVFYQGFKNPRWPVLTRHPNFPLSCYFMYFRALLQLLKAQFLLPCSSPTRMTWFALYTHHRHSDKQM